MLRCVSEVFTTSTYLHDCISVRVERIDFKTASPPRFNLAVSSNSDVSGKKSAGQRNRVCQHVWSEWQWRTGGLKACALS